MTGMQTLHSRKYEITWLLESFSINSSNFAHTLWEKFSQITFHALLCNSEFNCLFSGWGSNPISRFDRWKAPEEWPAQWHAQGDHAWVLLPHWVLPPQQPGTAVLICSISWQVSSQKELWTPHQFLGLNSTNDVTHIECLFQTCLIQSHTGRGNWIWFQLCSSHSASLLRSYYGGHASLAATSLHYKAVINLTSNSY